MRTFSATQFLCCLFALSAMRAAEARSPRVAVLPVTTQSDKLSGKSEQLTAKIEQRIARISWIDLIPASEVLEKANAASAILQSEDATRLAPEVGKALGADWVFVPFVTLEEKFSNCTVNVVDPYTGKLAGGYDVMAGPTMAALFDSFDALRAQIEMDAALKKVAEAPREPVILAAVPVITSDKLPTDVAGLLAALDEAYKGGLAAKAQSYLTQLEKLEPESPHIEAWRRKLGRLIDLGGDVSMALVEIPPGAYIRGSRSTDEYHDDNEEPLRRVVIDYPFLIGRTEVTQEQWIAVMDNDLARNKDPKRPMESVSWYDAQAFCGKLSQTLGRTVRLPSEAEWEYVCRAGSRKRFAFGDSANDLDTYGWHRRNSDSTHQTAMKEPNPFGLFDLHGNVWEWCLDHASDDYELAPLDGSPWISEKPRIGRVLRGGSWRSMPWACRCADRYFKRPDYRDDDIGFRIVVEMPREVAKQESETD